MAQHDYVLDNASGLNFRQDANDALQAIVSINSGSSAPTTTYAYMMWIDTSSNPTLKIRNAANSAWITIGRVDQTNLGMLLLTGGTMSGALTFSNTDYMKVPVGTTAQRPGSPADGMVRYNTDLVQFEGYKNSAWGAIGGGGYSVATVLSISASGTITTTTTDQRQLIPIQGNSAAVSASTTPFGSGGGWRDGTEVLLIGNDDTNTVTLTYNDAAKGLVGNFTSIEVTKYKTFVCVYNSALDRWILQGAY